MWDLMGKQTGRPVHDLFGGAFRSSVGYFHFLQGATIDELVADAQHAVSLGAPVFYLKLGLGERHDLESASCAPSRARVGVRAPARGPRRGRRAVHARGRVSEPLRAISPRRSALGLSERTCVARSTATRPKVGR
jgi:L-alanine-DL-glutamate epimerase-like enolase superfamily enzyme